MSFKTGERFYEARTKWNPHNTDPKKPQSINVVAREIGIPTSSLSLYEDGKRLPNMKNAIRIAEYYNVNVQWLLGTSDSRSRDENSQKITEQLGLSTDAIEQLRLMGKEKMDCLNALLVSCDFKKALDNLSYAKEVSRRIEDYIPPKPEIIGKEIIQDIIDGELVEIETDEYEYVPQTADEYADMIERSDLVEILPNPQTGYKGKQRLGNIVSDRQKVKIFRYEAIQDIGNAFRKIAPADEEERKGK